MRGEQGRGSQRTGDRFRRRLADLKRNGCNVLLVGTDALDAACERLLGESSAGPRYRLFVTADVRPPTAHARLASVQAGPYSDAAAVVDWHADVRGNVDVRSTDVRSNADVGGGAAVDGADARRSSTRDSGADAGGSSNACDGDGATAVTGIRDGDATVRTASVESDDLDELRAGVEDAIASFERDAGDLSPAELRLCVDSMTPLVADYDDRTVERFLVDVTDAVAAVDGMGHYHLPAEYDAETVTWLEPLFDAVVEVRRADGRVEQRWHVSDLDPATGWLPL